MTDDKRRASSGQVETEDDGPERDLSGDSSGGTVELEALDILDDQPNFRPPPLPCLETPPSDAAAASPQAGQAPNSADQTADAAEQFVKKLTAEAEAVKPQRLGEASQDRPPAAVDTGAPAAPAGPTKASKRARSTRRYMQSQDGIAWHKLDYREAALLAQVDGQRSRDAVISATELDARTGGELFDGLVERGLIREV